VPRVSSSRYRSFTPPFPTLRARSDKRHEPRPPMDPALTSPGRLAAIDTSLSSDRLAPWSDGDAALSSKSHCVSTPCAVSAATAACVCMVRCEFTRDLLRVLYLCQLEEELGQVARPLASFFQRLYQGGNRPRTRSLTASPPTRYPSCGACRMDSLGGIGIHQCSKIVPYYHSSCITPSHCCRVTPVLTVHLVYRSCIPLVVLDSDGIIHSSALSR